MERGKRKGSIILQVGLLFAVCVLVTGIVTYITQLTSTTKYVMVQTEKRAQRAAAEVISAFEEYPSYRLLIDYWYENYEKMDIEYDARFTNSTRTEYKSHLLENHQPDFDPRYASVESVKRLPEEDRKLYAEVVYSWILTRMNEIKTIHYIDYLFIVVSDEPYDKQFFLMSAASPGAVRGTDYEEVYPIGVQVKVGESQQEGMKNAVNHNSQIASAGEYVDYYSYFRRNGDQAVLIGMTYNLSEILDTVRSETQNNSLRAMAYQILYSALLSVGIFFLVLKPLKKVQKSIRSYKDSKDSAAVATDLSEVKQNNEIGHLAADVKDLSKEIDDYLEKIRTITADRERLDAELSLGAEIQSSMLPHEFPPFPDKKEFDLYASMEPAREVGGDFYDFFLIDDDHLGMVIADVSGKGVPAALFMMVSMIVIKTYAMMGVTPSEVLENANESICSTSHAEMFVTVWIGILELSTGKLKASNAGHEYPALMNADGDFELYKEKHGFVVGGVEGVKYTDYEVELEPGSKLFVYTDGLPEASDSDDNMFGTDRLIDVLNEKKDDSPEEILADMKKAVDEFVKDAEQFDDLTMLCLEYRGK